MSEFPSISAPSPGKNRQWCLKERLEPGEMVGLETFDLVEVPIPAVQKGQILLRTLCLGTSPAQRGYVTNSPSMHDKVNPGDVMRGRGVAVVADSHADGFAAGDLVVATTGWQDYCAFDPHDTSPYAPAKITNPVAPYSLSLGILGAAGITAYFGLTGVGEIKAGDTVLVSAAAGGVGSCAVQIAKAMGCRVIGIAGGPKKYAWLRDHLGIETTIDYRTGNLNVALADLCPDGLDVYFDNVGGEQLQAALNHLALGARIVICGFIATDYADEKTGPSNYTNLLRRRARMEGYFVFDYKDRFAEAEHHLKTWYRDGKIVDNTDLMMGLENMPLALQSLFTGGNTGVRLCQVASNEELGLA